MVSQNGSAKYGDDNKTSFLPPLGDGDRCVCGGTMGRWVTKRASRPDTCFVMGERGVSLL